MVIKSHSVLYFLISFLLCFGFASLLFSAPGRITLQRGGNGSEDLKIFDEAFIQREITQDELKFSSGDEDSKYKLQLSQYQGNISQDENNLVVNLHRRIVSSSVIVTDPGTVLRWFNVSSIASGMQNITYAKDFLEVKSYLKNSNVSINIYTDNLASGDFVPREREYGFTSTDGMDRKTTRAFIIPPVGLYSFKGQSTIGLFWIASPSSMTLTELNDIAKGFSSQIALEPIVADSAYYSYHTLCLQASTQSMEYASVAYTLTGGVDTSNLAMSYYSLHLMLDKGFYHVDQINPNLCIAPYQLDLKGKHAPYHSRLMDFNWGLHIRTGAPDGIDGSRFLNAHKDFIATDVNNQDSTKGVIRGFVYFFAEVENRTAWREYSANIVVEKVVE